MVTYGADYSGGELSPGDLDGFADYDLRFLIRYIGFPDNPKCISNHPGAFADHVNAGRVVLLVAEGDEDDPAGGFAGGQDMAARARADADSIGYPGHLPIFFCADAWLNSRNIELSTAMDYLRGAASVIGRDRVGAYGFRDFVGAAQAQSLAHFRWLCGAAPTRDEETAHLCHFYQWNNGQIVVNDLTCDLNWAYIDVDTLTTRNQPVRGTRQPARIATTPDALPTLHAGDQNPSVLSLQRFMTHTFSAYNRYDPTGFYGPLTTAGIKEFQRRTRIDGDGTTVGPQTKRQLFDQGWRNE
jgi:hypothetical protein